MRAHALTRRRRRVSARAGGARHVGGAPQHPSGLYGHARRRCRTQGLGAEAARAHALLRERTPAAHRSARAAAGRHAARQGAAALLLLSAGCPAALVTEQEQQQQAATARRDAHCHAVRHTPLRHLLAAEHAARGARRVGRSDGGASNPLRRASMPRVAEGHAHDMDVAFFPLAVSRAVR